MDETICTECGVNYHRDPHKAGCNEFEAFLNRLGAQKARDKQRAEEFLAEHFVIVSVP